MRYLQATAPRANVQISGGEPTCREDLALIVRLARDHGIPFVQLNTNGLRLGRELDYASHLADAGLNTIFLQFDGVDDLPYMALRGRPLLDSKKAAIERCGEAGLGVVLVPTLSQHVNLDQVGAIIDFAVTHLPVVRGVHLQPLTRFGRVTSTVSSAPRLTLPEVLSAVITQTSFDLSLDAFGPANCEHPMCSFQGQFLKKSNGHVVSLSHPPLGDWREPPNGSSHSSAACCSGPERARRTALRWTGPTSEGRRGDLSAEHSEYEDHSSWVEAVAGTRGRTFSITGMAFQDAATFDLQRVQNCHLHVLSPDCRLIPFCVYNVTGSDGRHLARGRSAQRSRPGVQPGRTGAGEGAASHHP